jgi:phosphoglycerol transferase MdoB-like AlkP superfamily enzyme
LGFSLPGQIIRLAKRILFLLLSYSILRIGYFLYHYSIYKSFSNADIVESFMLGIRFDLAAIFFLNAPLIILNLIPLDHKPWNKFERVFFVTLNSLGFLISLVDYELFQFVGKRLSLELFLISDDIKDQLPQLALYYWYFPLLATLFGYFFYLFDQKYFKVSSTAVSKRRHLIFSILFLFLSFVAIRGGLQHKSINVQSAFSQGQNELGHLVLNTPYHFLRTFKSQSYKKLSYFKSDYEALEIILKGQVAASSDSLTQKKNIVLILLESFSSEYLEKGYMPFLDELKARSIFFPYHLANGRRSIEVLPSVLCGLPSLLKEPLSKSIFQSNKLSCLPSSLKSHGYTNYFFHGGAKGTMGFESFTLANGFDRYFSKDDYPGDDYDGTWGIFDGPFFQYSALEIDKMKAPFMAGIFTLSSHQPYAVPKEYAGKFPKGTLEIHESIRYTDFSLREFFKTIETKPWYKNTIFIITADHTSKLESKKFQNIIGHYRVPLLIFNPLGPQGQVIEKVSQHSDIPRMVLDMLGLKGELPLTSKNILKNAEGNALNLINGSDFILMNKDHFLLQKNDQQTLKYSYNWNTGESQLIGESSDQLLKANLQYFFNSLINNKFPSYR